MAILHNTLPVLYTRNVKHTAEVIKLVAEKLQSVRKHRVQTMLPTYRKQQKPKGSELSEWQLYILSSFPGIGTVLADKLLRKFGSLKAVFNASPTELSRVEGVSDEKAQLIRRILEHRYSGSGNREKNDLTKFYNRSD